MTQAYLTGMAAGLLMWMFCLSAYIWWRGRNGQTSLLAAVARRLEALAGLVHALAAGVDEASRVWTRAKGARLTFRKPRTEVKNAEV